MNIQFSFIVACYNSQKFLSPCLDSLVHQNYNPDNYEIVCIDDGSTDDSRKIALDYAKTHNQLRVLWNENRGLEKTCNRGIQEAQFDRIVRVDSDDMLDRNFLFQMAGAIEKKLQYDFYYCQKYVEYYSQNQQTKKELPEFDKNEIFNRGDFFATGTVYKKSDLLNVGLYSEEVKNCGLENYNLILRLLSLGKQGEAVPEAFFYYRRHTSNMSIVKKNEIIAYGKKLLNSYGKNYSTNKYHPYGLKIDQV